MAKKQNEEEAEPPKSKTSSSSAIYIVIAIVVVIVLAALWYRKRSADQHAAGQHAAGQHAADQHAADQHAAAAGQSEDIVERHLKRTLSNVRDGTRKSIRRLSSLLPAAAASRAAPRNNMGFNLRQRYSTL